VGELLPYRVDVAEEVLTDLAERLRRTRLPDEVPPAAAEDWSQGMPLAYLRGVLDYWQGGYDWRAAEAEINGYEQFVTVVEQQPIHFLHVRSPHEGAVPLLLIHGWPGSLVEFLDVIAPLTDPPDPADAFHVVVPSLPGYGCSVPLVGQGWNARTIAPLFAEVMRRLGYDGYGVQGGDWGAVVAYNLAEQFADRVLGMHVNLMNVPLPKGETPAPPTEWMRRVGAAGGGYDAILGTRPQTMGYLLDDSPAGLAAFLIEKFHEWVDPARSLAETISLDRLLTNVMLYWVNRTGASSARLYWEKRIAPKTQFPQSYVGVPTGVANFPGELIRSRRTDAERHFNIVHWTEPSQGGHFPSLEVPGAFTADVREFFRPLRLSAGLAKVTN